MKNKRVALKYLSQLQVAGIPSIAAVPIAWAIANFEIANILPNRQKAQLLRQYKSQIIEAGLWKAAFEEAIAA